MTPGYARPRSELPWLPYESLDRVIINSHNFTPAGPLYPTLQDAMAGYTASRDAGGTTADDQFGGDENGTLVNGVSRLDSGGLAYSMTRASQHAITLGTPASLPIDGEMSLSCWVKLSGSAYTTRQAIIVRSNSGYLTSLALVYSQGGSKSFGFWQSAGVGPVVTTAIVEDTNWHHLAVTRAGSTGSWAIKIFLDGTETSVSTSGNSQSTANDVLAIGRWGNVTGSVAEHFDGLMDDIVIWDRPLTTDEVANLGTQRGAIYL